MFEIEFVIEYYGIVYVCHAYIEFEERMRLVVRAHPALGSSLKL